VLFSFAVLPSRGCLLDTTLDEVSTSTRVQLQQLGVDSCMRLFRAFPIQMATTAPDIEVVLAFHSDMAEVLADVALRTANLSSV
jgi:hypothetical protein